MGGTWSERAISFQYDLKVTGNNKRLATSQPAAREEADQVNLVLSAQAAFTEA